MRNASKMNGGGRFRIFEGGSRHFLALSLVVLLSATSFGCQRNNITREWDETVMQAYTPEEEPVTLGPGDVIDVRFSTHPELNEIEPQVVRPDGRIALPLIDYVDVAGLTPEELDAKLTELYSDQLIDPELVVHLRTVRNRRIYVSGQVNVPGFIEMPGKLTALEAVMEAGGYIEDTARPAQILVVRHVNGERYAKLINLNLEDLTNPGWQEPFYLEPRDIVYVPETRIVEANRFVDQYINRMIPTIGRDWLLFQVIQN